MTRENSSHDAGGGLRFNLMFDWTLWMPCVTVCLNALFYYLHISLWFDISLRIPLTESFSVLEDTSLDLLQKSVFWICSSLSFLQSRFSTLLFPSVLPPEGCSLRILFSWWWAETWHAWRALILQQWVWCDNSRTASHSKLEKVYW